MQKPLVTWAIPRSLILTYLSHKETRQNSILDRVCIYISLPLKRMQIFAATFTDYLDALTSLFVLEHVTSNSWPSFLYKSTPINIKSKAGRTPVDICASVDPVEMLGCDVVYMDDTHCHYGNISTTNGTFSLSGASWNLWHRKPGNISSVDMLT